MGAPAPGTGACRSFERMAGADCQAGALYPMGMHGIWGHFAVK